MVVIIVFSSIYFEQNGTANPGFTAIFGLISGLGALLIFSLVPACLAGLAWIGHRLRSSSPDKTKND
jgi:hypothetical protein